jgi:hypothetical protein
LPRYPAYPPGIEIAPAPDRALPDAPGGVRGSCLCGAVAYRIEGEAQRAWCCHCSRCRKARSAAHASNLFVPIDALHWTRGEDRLASYKVPEALRFMQVFCATCGSPMPRADRDRGIAVVPMGSLDDAPALRPQRHIFAASKAPWYEIEDDLPQDAEYPA